MKKKEYVSPRLVRVRLEPSQAVLSQCSVGSTNISHAKLEECRSLAEGGCKQGAFGHGGDSGYTS